MQSSVYNCKWELIYSFLYFKLFQSSIQNPFQDSSFWKFLKEQHWQRKLCRYAFQSWCDVKMRVFFLFHLAALSTFSSANFAILESKVFTTGTASTCKKAKEKSTTTDTSTILTLELRYVDFECFRDTGFTGARTISRHEVRLFISHHCFGKTKVLLKTIIYIRNSSINDLNFST